MPKLVLLFLAFLHLICILLASSTRALFIPFHARGLFDFPQGIDPLGIDTRSSTEGTSSIARQPHETLSMFSSTSPRLSAAIHSSTTATGTVSALASFHTYSIIGTPGMGATREMSTITSSPLPGTTYPVASRPSSTATHNNLAPGEFAQWKVIGIAVISVSTVAFIILTTAFFDSWSAFLSDVFLGKRKREGSEDLIPDWETREWRHKLDMEENHRYPSHSSLEKLTSPPKGRDMAILEAPVLPRPTYQPEYEPTIPDSSWSPPQQQHRQRLLGFWLPA